MSDLLIHYLDINAQWVCVCVSTLNPHILFSANGTLVYHGPSIPRQHKIAETNNINNEPTKNGFHSHFNGIAIRVTLAWQPSSA